VSKAAAPLYGSGLRRSNTAWLTPGAEDPYARTVASVSLPATPASFRSHAPSQAPRPVPSPGSMQTLQSAKSGCTAVVAAGARVVDREEPWTSFLLDVHLCT